jgi:hypothetical protein
MPLAVSALIACNAIAGLDDDFALDGGGGPIDGSTPPLPDGSSSGNNPIDASVEDRTVPDAEASVPDAADAEPTPFTCARPPVAGQIFCWDFNGSASGPNWGWPEVFNNGSVLVVEPGSGFASKGLRARSSPGSSALFQGSLQVPNWTTQTVTLTFRFRVVTSPAGTSYSAIAAIEFGGTEYGLATYSYNCNGAGGAPCVDETDSTNGHHHDSANSFRYVQNQWYLGEVAIQRIGGSFGGIVKVDGIVVDQRSSGAIPDKAAPTAVRLGVGAFYPGGTGAETNVDDVLVRYQ